MHETFVPKTGKILLQIMRKIDLVIRRYFKLIQLRRTCHQFSGHGRWNLRPGVHFRFIFRASISPENATLIFSPASMRYLYDRDINSVINHVHHNRDFRCMKFKIENWFDEKWRHFWEENLVFGPHFNYTFHEIEYKNLFFIIVDFPRNVLWIEIIGKIVTWIFESRVLI